MNNQPTETMQAITTGAILQWVNAPLAVALVFALAGAFFLAIYSIRRIRGKTAPTDKA